MNKVFIIGEIGINHAGSLDTAKQLIIGAKKCGANLVKFQKRTIPLVYSKEELDKPREHPLNDDQTNRGQKIALEFNKEDYDEIDRYCKELEILWTASAWDLQSVEFLKQYDLKYNKIASAMISHKELLNAIAEQKKYTFISTGMSTLNEIQEAVYIFKKWGCEFELMHCNSQYPMPDDQANLLCILRLKEIFNCNVGYSGHEVGIIVSVAAVALGATSIERHLTINRSSYGSDQAASLELVGFERLVKYIRAVESAMGDGTKRISEAEEKIAKKLKRTHDFNA